jgi:endoglucanase
MFGEARRIFAWGALSGAALLGCQEKVYLGNPIGLADHALPEAAPPIDAPLPTDAFDAPAMDEPPIDAPMEADAPFPWYLHGVGSQIFDSNDGLVRLRGINWSGMESVTRVPDGLHGRTVESIVAEIERLSFNLIRIPFSSESISPSSVPTPNPTLDPIAGDPSLTGLTSLEVLDRIVDAAFRHHLRIIFDHYRFLAADMLDPPAKWYSGSDPSSPTGGFPESQWRQDWISLATRYAQKPSVVGCDLHDALAAPSTWGDGNPNTDWRLAAERAGNDILSANPNLVILVQGIDVVNGQAYWPGGNLHAAQSAPVNLMHPEKLFYSVQDWGRSVNTDKPWFFADAGFPNDLPTLWDDTWGYLVTGGTKPVVLSAFGDYANQPGLPADIVAADLAWRNTLISYVSSRQLSFAFWALNPSAEGKTGLLEYDWQTPDPAWSMLLQLNP